MSEPENKIFTITIGHVIAWRRTRLSLSQRELACASGVPQSSISRFERGESSPDTLMLKRLAVGLGTDLQRLTSDVESVWQRLGVTVAATRGRDLGSWWEQVSGLPEAGAFVGGVVALAMGSVDA